MPLCTACGQENPDVARFCLACGTPFAAAPPAPEEERRVLTVVFTDIVGSTASAEQLDPEDVRARLAPYYARVSAELERFGGSVEKFIGDAVVAVFGAPTTHEDDPERAVRAAIAIREAIAELNESDPWFDLNIRTGVTTGEALVVLGMDPGSGEGMAAGDVMNTAARVQSAAPVNEILVNAETYRATAHAIEYRDAESVAAKGKSKPVQVWVAVGVKDTPGLRPASQTPLVGRAKELELLGELWERVRSTSRPSLANVLAAPGVGKSRLLAEFAARATADGAVYWGRCLPYGEGITYWPVAEILKGAAGIMQSDDAETTSRKLGALLEGLDSDRPDELRTIAAALANLVGVPRTPQGTYSAAEITQAELHWGVRRVLELLAAKRPLVLVFEDLHWAEPTLLDLVRFLFEGEVAAPLLVLGSARPELAEREPSLLVRTEDRRVIELAPLSGGESEALLAGLAGAARLPVRTVETLVRNAGGNPLFLEETVRMLSEPGAAAEGDGREALPVPTSLQALIGSRLDQLPGDERRLAQHASVIGAVFWSGAVAALDGASGEVGSAIEGLEARDIVRAQSGSTIAGEREYAFKHILIRDVAYGRLPKGRRTELHVRVSDWVCGLPGGGDEFVEIIAYHLEEACRLARQVARSPVEPPIARAIEALSAAAEKSERREGFREADRFYTRALEIVDSDGAEAAIRLRLQRGRMLVALGDLKRAAGELEQVASEALTPKRPEVRCEALVVLAGVDGKQARPVRARERLLEAQRIAREVGDRSLEIRASYELTNVLGWFEGDIEAAVDEGSRALALAEELDDRALRIEGHMRLGFLLYNMGALARAEDQLARCSALAGELGSHRDEARATFLLGRIKYYRGELDEAERLSLDARDWFERTADSYLQIQNLTALGKYAFARGDLELAEARFRDVLPLALQAGGWLVVEVYRYLAEVLVREGRTRDAQELVAFAARDVPETDPYAQAALLVAEGIVAAAGEERTATSTAFVEAQRLLEENQLQLDLGETRVAYARALRSFGEEAGARTELERARTIFARMDARGLLAEIDRELGELRGRPQPTAP